MCVCVWAHTCAYNYTHMDKYKHITFKGAARAMNRRIILINFLINMDLKSLGNFFKWH